MNTNICSECGGFVYKCEKYGHIQPSRLVQVVQRVLATAEQLEAGVWRISSDNIQLLKEAISQEKGIS